MDFSIVMFNPQPEPPGARMTAPVAQPPEPIAMLLPAVQAAR